MKLTLLVFTIMIGGSCLSWAGDQGDRFVEFQEDNDTVTYDLKTVTMITPGRFTIIETTIDHVDVMKFELTVLGTLRNYCTRAVGNYPAPSDVLTLGPPDMPVYSIKVESPQLKRAGKSYPNKVASWKYRLLGIRC